MDSIHDIFSRASLREFLRKFETVPDTHRVTVWKTILALPCNKNEYLRLRNLGKRNIPKDSFLLRNSGENKTVLNVLRSLLAHSPSLKELDEFLTRFVEPFAVVFPNDELVFFEVVLSILLNYSQHWFDHIPKPPYTFLSMLDIVLLKQEPQLYRHLATRGVRCIDYMWSWICSAFTSIVNFSEWASLWDHIVCNEPSFVCFIPLAACTLNSHHLLALQNREDIMELLQDYSPRDSQTLLREAYRLYDDTPSEVHPSMMIHQFSPITIGNYPTLNPTDHISFNSVKSGASTQVGNLLDKVRETGVEVDRVLAEGLLLRRNLCGIKDD